MDLATGRPLSADDDVRFLSFWWLRPSFVVIPKGFIPSEDIGQIFGLTEAGQGISFESMKGHQLALADVIRQDPNVDSFSSSVGAGGPNAT